MPHSNESVLTQKEPVKYTNKKDNVYHPDVRLSHLINIT